MGLYPPGNPISDSLNLEKHLPPLKLRRPQLKAVIDGFTLIPVFSYLPPSNKDDQNVLGCYYVE